MKKIVLFAAVLMFGFATSSNARGFRDRGIDFNYFYVQLAQQGEWIEIDRDVFVWRPMNVSYSWRPYSSGKWIYSEYGWYWDSYEPFGWATYHYGRWYYDDYYGWVWMPGYEWGPSWVEWRYNDVYVGWAPLPPYAEFRASIGIHFTITWHSNYTYWNFITYDHFCGFDVNRYIVHNRYNYRIFSKTRYRTDYGYRDGRIINRGIGREYVERRAGYRIAQRKIGFTKTMEGYKKSRISRGKDVLAFRPDDKSIEQTQKVRRYDIRRGRTNSRLRIDRLGVKRDKAAREISGSKYRSGDSDRRNYSRGIDLGRRSSTKYQQNDLRKSSPDNKVVQKRRPDQLNRGTRTNSKARTQMQKRSNNIRRETLSKSPPMRGGNVRKSPSTRSRVQKSNPSKSRSNGGKNKGSVKRR